MYRGWWICLCGRAREHKAAYLAALWGHTRQKHGNQEKIGLVLGNTEPTLSLPELQEQVCLQVQERRGKKHPQIYDSFCETHISFVSQRELCRVSGNQESQKKLLG